jgi:esterase/lipase superfamily enzyme
VRAVEHRESGLAYFGRERGPTSAGACTVDLDAREKRQVVGLQRRAVSEILDEYFASEPRVAVYVHGYNVGFEKSCRDAARLEERLAERRLLLFSWPAEGKVTAYLHDVGDVEWSVEPLGELILDLAARFGSRNVDLIAHSLGAKAVVDAITGDTIGRAALVLGRVVLIAPDLDADVFRRSLPKLSSRASTVTVYVSPQDRALKASRHVRNEPRLGEGSPGLSDLHGIDIVEVQQARWRWGSLHEYYLENAAVAEDLEEVLTGDPHPSGSRVIGH